MKSLLNSAVSVAANRSLLLGFVASQMLLQSSLADEIVNVSNIEDCRPIADNVERLLCYDTVADGGIFNEQQVEQAKKEEFGSKKKEFDKSDDRLSVTIVRIQNARNSVQYFHTADGAVWKKNGRGKWSLEVPFQAEIKAGVLTSYYLVTEGGKSVRVERVR